MNLLDNGDFATNTTGWTAENAELTVEGGQLRVETLGGGGPGLAYQVIEVESGGSYTISAVLGDATYPGSNHVRVGTDVNLDEGGSVHEGEPSLTFTAPSAQLYVTCNNVAATSGEFALFDDVVLTVVE